MPTLTNTAYLAGTLLRWIEEECGTRPDKWGAIAELYASWRAWAKTNNEWPGSKKRFSQALLELGYRRDRSSAIRGYVGIGLKASPPPYRMGQLWQNRRELRQSPHPSEGTAENRHS